MEKKERLWPNKTNDATRFNFEWYSGEHNLYIFEKNEQVEGASTHNLEMDMFNFPKRTIQQ